jgi:hypothetical protein
VMSDIVERLLIQANDSPADSSLYEEAAAEITRLRAENEQLRVELAMSPTAWDD